MQTQEMEADSLVVQDELLTSGPNENGFNTGQVLNRAETVTLAKLKAFSTNWRPAWARDQPLTGSWPDDERI